MSWVFQLEAMQMQKKKICHKHSFCFEDFRVDGIWISLGEETRSWTETLYAGIQLAAAFYGQVITAWKAGV